VKAGTPLLRLDPADAALNSNASRRASSSPRAASSGRPQLDFQRYERWRPRLTSRATNTSAPSSRSDTAAESYRSAEANYRLAANQPTTPCCARRWPAWSPRSKSRPGKWCHPATSPVRIAQDGERELVVSVPEGRVDELRRAQSLEVELWAGAGKRYAARVRELAPDIDPVTRTYDARVSILGADAAVRLGMTGKLDCNCPGRCAAQAAADRDLRRRRHTSVWVLDPATSRARLRRVELASAQRDGVLVRSGLRDGELVITAGVNLLHEGQKVRPLSEGGARARMGNFNLSAWALKHRSSCCS
jgi:multidrug efflux pump subunit AcrA (membrane-fusion protein)